MLETLCRTKTALTDQDIQQLCQLAAQLPLIAELTGADIFIDCAALDGRAIVVAQARPSTLGSAYRKEVVGEYALPDKEPAVFHALAMQVPVRDIKAITQENQTVQQDAVPVFSQNGHCIAVLIQEKDISTDLLQEKKFRTLARTYEEENRSLRSVHSMETDSAAIREVHHRMKNNLQLIASILNLQARRCSEPMAAKILRNNVNRVLSIASIHDILTQNTGSAHQIDALVLLEQLRRHVQVFVPEEKQLAIRVSGTAVLLPSGTASSVALAVNELLTNALEHAFPDRDSGTISVSFCPGVRFHTVTVADDGCGFEPGLPRPDHLGLSMVDATVRDRLHGHLTIRSDRSGSRVSFDFPTE